MRHTEVHWPSQICSFTVKLRFTLMIAKPWRNIFGTYKNRQGFKIRPNVRMVKEGFWINNLWAYSFHLYSDNTEYPRSLEVRSVFSISLSCPMRSFDHTWTRSEAWVIACRSSNENIVWVFTKPHHIVESVPVNCLICLCLEVPWLVLICKRGGIT